MKSHEVAKLIKAARDGATGSTMGMGELMRLCMRLGNLLSNEELAIWARREASGYQDDDKLPDYRVIRSEARGTFMGPMMAQLKNVQIPMSVIEKQHHDKLFTIRLTEPVSQLEAYSKQVEQGSMMSKHWSGDAIAYYQRQELYSNGYVLESAWNPVSVQQFDGIVETIRTRVLDFMMRIEKELDIDVDEPREVNSEVHVAQQQITNIFHNSIQGENIAMSNTGSAAAQKVNIKSGDYPGLEGYLKTLGLNEDDLKNLRKAVEADPKHPKDGFGPKVSAWLSKLSVKSLRGGLSIGKDIAASLIAEAIMQYYGIK